MSNPSKAKGTAAESAVVSFLRRWGFPYAERRTLNGSKDMGDITGIPDVAIEVKDAKTHALSSWMTEMEAEVNNANASVGWLVVKRKGKSDPLSWYWITTGDIAANLMLDAGYGRADNRHPSLRDDIARQRKTIAERMVDL